MVREPRTRSHPPDSGPELRSLLPLLHLHRWVSADADDVRLTNGRSEDAEAAQESSTVNKSIPQRQNKNTMTFFNPFHTWLNRFFGQDIARTSTYYYHGVPGVTAAKSLHVNLMSQMGFLEREFKICTTPVKPWQN